MSTIPMSQLSVNSKAQVVAVEHTGSMQRRLLELGLIPGAEIECVMKSGNGGMTGFMICGACIAFRQEDIEKIRVNTKA